jgi:segregation and condensation protein A
VPIFVVPLCRVRSIAFVAYLALVKARAIFDAMTCNESRKPTPPIDDWTTGPGHASVPDAALHLDIDGYEGPLDLLLALARTQKVDLNKLSISALVDQYLTFITETQLMRLEVAADYLVMAAWLAFLKSRLLIPSDNGTDDGPSGKKLAQRLSFRLMRLEVMRDSAARLLTRHRLGRDVFARGTPEGVKTVRETQYRTSIYDLLHAYTTQRVQAIRQVHHVKNRTVWSINDARRQLERLVGNSSGEWIQLDFFLHQYLPKIGTVHQLKPSATQRSVLAASFGASLELAREGVIDIRQDATYAPLYMKRRAPLATGG